LNGFCDLWGGVMTLWMRERDQLIEQTRAFVEGIEAARPMRGTADVRSEARPARAAEPPRPIELPVAIVARPIVSERAEIERRVAKFKAQQEKFRQAREADYREIFSRTRATGGNAASL
jgi:hypothetical protein